ncbi:Apoptosis-inducing factor 1 [Microsporum audouinii]
MSEYKLIGSSPSEIKNGDKIEVQVEGLEGVKLLLVKLDDQVHALTAKCTHYGAPLAKGVLTSDARITCPWHGACFNVISGDVEDAPAPNALKKYDITEKEGAFYVKTDEASLKAWGREPVKSCKVASNDKVVVVGGGSGAFGTIESLRELGYSGSITMISKEPNLPLDRTKFSKALIADPSRIELRPKDWYSNVSVETVSDEVTAVDFEKKSVATKSGKSYPYTKLVLATGGTPRRLPLPGFKELNNIFTLRYVTDVQAILAAVGEKGKNIVVIGSSFIGMEVGNALAKENKVTIVGMESAPLERVMGAEVGRVFQRNLEKSGVKFHMSASVEKATPSSADASKVGTVHLKDGTELPADLVILGVGVAPATEYIKENRSVKLEGDGSLKTDESFAVEGLKDVFAIGDIATYPYHGPGGQNGKAHVRIEHWNVAQNSGRSVGRTITHSATSSHPIKPKPFIPIFWSALGAQLRYCGNTMNGYDDVVMKGELENAKFAAFYTLGDTVVAVATMGMDPIVSKSAELMRRGNMPGKKELQAGTDVLTVDLPGAIAM